MSSVGRATGWGHSRTASDKGEGRKERVSFASSSFSPTRKPTSVEGGSPSESTSLSSNSSSSSPSHAGSFSMKHRSRSNPSLPPSAFSILQTRRASLPPEQVCDLARSSLQLAASGDASASVPAYSGPFPHTSSDLPPRPATLFTPLPESHYLPFIDRPSEVGDLLSTDANRRFMALLKQTFPLHLRDALGNPDDEDPSHWSFHSLHSFLTQCPRSICPDAIWVSKARRCIRPRSEVVWERFKDVIGVPSELDVNEFCKGGDAGGRQSPDVDEEEDDAWIEPIFPLTSPLSLASPGVTSVSPIDIGDGGFGFGGRGIGMETIGEGEGEEDDVPTATNTRTNSLEGDTAKGVDQPFEPIRALRLCTRLSFSEGRTTPPETTGIMPSSEESNSKSMGRSYSLGHDGRVRPHPSNNVSRSLSHGHIRRPNAGRPEFERGPGNPLFPSNFGRLSVGPTLAANNPTLRQQFAPQPSAYSAPSSRRYTNTYTATEPQFDDRVHPTASTGSDYAISFASGSDKSS